MGSYSQYVNKEVALASTGVSWAVISSDLLMLGGFALMLSHSCSIRPSGFKYLAYFSSSTRETSKLMIPLLHNILLYVFWSVFRHKLNIAEIEIR